MRQRNITAKCDVCGRIIIAKDKSNLLGAMANHKAMHKGEKRPDVAVQAPKLDSPRMKYKVISDTEIRLTKAKAYEFLELPTFAGERHVTDSHVQRLYEAWKSGRFMWEHVIIAACVFNGKTYRINGQHTCWMRVNIDGEDGDFKARTIFYAVDSEEDMRSLYSTFDQNKPRSSGHVVRVLLTGTSAGKELWSSTLGVVAAGLKLWLFESYHRKVSAQAISGLIEEKHSALFQTVGLFFQSHYKGGGTKEMRWLRRSSVIGALFATFNSGIEKAREFWDPVVTGLGLLKANDPRHQLRKFITTHAHFSSTGGDKEMITQEDMYRVCLGAWNKWKKGETQDMGYRLLDKRPKVM